MKNILFDDVFIYLFIYRDHMMTSVKAMITCHRNKHCVNIALHKINNCFINKISLHNTGLLKDPE